jgi:hypothetical protein
VARSPLRYVLRDDDTSAFTDPRVLERAYGDIWDRVPVSLAVIPFAVKTWNWGDPFRFRQGTTPHPVGENGPLVRFLRWGRDAGHLDVMLHGWRHRYEPGPEPGSWIPEFIHLADPGPALIEGRRHLQELGLPVSVFVPPSNALSPAAYAAVRAEGMHLTQLHPLRVGLRGAAVPGGIGAGVWELVGAGRRASTRLLTGREPAGVLDFGTHREVLGIPLTPSSRSDVIFAELRHRLGRGGAVCLATHHWELDVRLRDESLTVGELLRELLDWLADRGAEAVTAHELLDPGVARVPAPAVAA